MVYAYVQAIVTTALPDGPGSIRFRHTTVTAPDEATAYHLGQRWAGQFDFHPETETVNDYVFEA